MLDGVRLTLLLGPRKPVPAPTPLVEALSSVEVVHNDDDRSGFTATFLLDPSRGGAVRKAGQTIIDIMDKVGTDIQFISPRPYMAPALEKERPNLPLLWRNSIKKG